MANEMATQELDPSVLLSAATTGRDAPAVPSKSTEPRIDVEGVGLCVRVAEVEADCVPLADWVAEGVSVAEGVGVALRVSVTDALCETLGVWLDVAVDVPLGVAVCVEV